MYHVIIYVAIFQTCTCVFCRIDIYTFFIYNCKFYESDANKHACHECVKEQIDVEPLSFDLDVTDDKGETLLMKAIKTEQVDIAQILISKNVDVNIQDKKGQTALHWAASKQLHDIYNMLIQHNTTDIDITDDEGHTAFEYLLSHEIMPYLMSTKMLQLDFLGGERKSNQQEFMQLYNNFVKQLFEIHKNHDTNIQGTNNDYYFSELDNKIMIDIINIIKNMDSFTNIVQIDAIMMKITQAVQNYIQQVKIFRVNHGDAELLTQNLLYRLLAQMNELQNEVKDIRQQLKELQKGTSE